MSRYIGPKARVSRRLGTNIWGTRGEAIALDKRPVPARRTRAHPASRQCVGVPAPAPGEAEGPLHLRPHRAPVPQPVQGSQPAPGRHRREHAPATWSCASTTSSTAPDGPPPAPQARQLVVNHGHVDVNGRRVTVPSYRLRKGDEVTLRDKTRNMVVVQWNLDVLDRSGPGVDRHGRVTGYGDRCARAAASVSRSTCPSANSSSSSSTASKIRPTQQPRVACGGPLRSSQRYSPRCWSFSDRLSKRLDEADPATANGSPSVHSSPASATRSATPCGGHCCRPSPVRRGHPGPLRRSAPRVRHHRRCHRGRHRHPLERQGPRAAVPQRRAGDVAPRRARAQGRCHRIRPDLGEPRGRGAQRRSPDRDSLSSQGSSGASIITVEPRPRLRVRGGATRARPPSA